MPVDWFSSLMFPPLRSAQSQGVYGSEVMASREDAKRTKLHQLEPTAFKSGGATVVLDPIANYNPSLTNVRPTPVATVPPPALPRELGCPPCTCAVRLIATVCVMWCVCVSCGVCACA